MEQRPLGNSGLVVSALGFGCGAVGGLMVKGEAGEQRAAVERAVAAGIRYFDTAPGYGNGRSEENLGRVLAEIGAAADQLVAGTKVRLDPALFSESGDAPAVVRAVRESTEASLRRLRRERVHLLQLHNRIASTSSSAERSGSLAVDHVLGPVAAALHAVQAAGLAQHVGVTGTGDAGAVKRVLRSGVVATAQVYFNVLNPSAGYRGHAPAGEDDFDGLVDDAAASHVGVIVIRPLAAGAVTGVDARHAYAGNAGNTGGGIAGERYADHLARARGLTSLVGDAGLESPVELAFRFALSKPGVSTVLVGFSDATQLEDAIRWAERGPLPGDVLQRALALSAG